MTIPAVNHPYPCLVPLVTPAETTLFSSKPLLFFPFGLFFNLIVIDKVVSDIPGDKGAKMVDEGGWLQLPATRC